MFFGLGRLNKPALEMRQASNSVGHRHVAADVAEHVAETLPVPLTVLVEDLLHQKPRRTHKRGRL